MKKIKGNKRSIASINKMLTIFRLKKYSSPKILHRIVFVFIFSYGEKWKHSKNQNILTLFDWNFLF